MVNCVFLIMAKLLFFPIHNLHYLYSKLKFQLEQIISISHLSKYLFLMKIQIIEMFAIDNVLVDENLQFLLMYFALGYSLTGNVNYVHSNFINNSTY